MILPVKSIDEARTAQRRSQILKAATDCFQRRGFHNTSMAEISKAARMSVGHIYHYFENKNAIIAALVDEKSQEIALKLDEVRSQPDLCAGFIDSCAQSIDKVRDQPSAALRIEMLAEGARNPAVLEILKSGDETAKPRLLETLMLAIGPRCTPEYAEGVATAMISMFEGLGQRAILDPGFHKQATALAMRRALRAMLAPPPEDGGEES